MKNKNLILPIIILGLSFILAISLAKPIGVSTEFSVTSGIIHDVINPEVVKSKSNGHIKSKIDYHNKNQQKVAKNIKNPISYGMLFVLSIPLGAFLAKFILKKSAINTKHITRNSHILNNPFILFIGGFLLLFGARWAGGCTSGHMMSGITQSSISGFTFAIVVFIFAIITSLLIYYKKGKI